MDFSKLSQNEKLAVYGSAAVIIGGLVGYSYGLTVLAVLAAIVMLGVVLLPQLSPSTRLPGSRGTLMLLAGGVAGVILVLAVLLYIGTVFTAFDVRDLFFLIAVVGGVLMAWVGWQEFQAEGGKFQLGSASTPAAPPASTGGEPEAPATTPSATPSEPAAPPPPPAAPAAPPPDTSPPPPPAAPLDRDDENRPPGG
jgi:hypothetical protein